MFIKNTMMEYISQESYEKKNCSCRFTYFINCNDMLITNTTLLSVIEFIYTHEPFFHVFEGANYKTIFFISELEFYLRRNSYENIQIHNYSRGKENKNSFFCA